MGPFNPELHPKLSRAGLKGPPRWSPPLQSPEVAGDQPQARRLAAGQGLEGGGWGSGATISESLLSSMASTKRRPAAWASIPSGRSEFFLSSQMSPTSLAPAPSET